MSAKSEVMLPEKYLEVGLTPDGREVIINHPVDPETVRLGFGHIVFSPDQARRLAKLLLRKADQCSPSRDPNLSTPSARDPDIARRIETRELIATVRRVAKEQPLYRPETILHLNLAAAELERLAYPSGPGG